MEQLHLFSLVLGVWSLLCSVNGQTAQCRKQLDVCVALDSSDLNLATVDRLGRIKEALNNYLGMYDIGLGAQNDRIGVCTYGESVTVPVPMNQEQDLNLIREKIGSVVGGDVNTGLLPVGGVVNTNLGLLCCRDMLLTQGRSDKQDLTVLVTLGNPDALVWAATDALVSSTKVVGHLSVLAIGNSFTDIVTIFGYASDEASVTFISDYDVLVSDSVAASPDAYQSWCPDLTGVDPCSGCLWRNGIGYAPGPECWQYYQCTVMNDELVPRIMNTAYGTYWDNPSLSQRAPGPLWDCPLDRCKSLPAESQFGRPDNCRIYMQCRADIPSTFFIDCCPEGTGFVEGQGCVTDPTCQDVCMPDTTEQPCDLTEIPGSPAIFRQGTETMSCPPGTRFSQAECVCVMDEVEMTRLMDAGFVCEPDLDLVFDASGVRDASRNRSPVTNIDVTIRDAGNGFAAVFNNSQLRIDRFANLDVQNKFAIYMQVRPLGPGHQNEAIVSNSDCQVAQETFAVLLDSPFGFPEVRGFARTMPDIQSETLPALLPPDQFSDVVYEYNGAALSLYVNDGLGPLEYINTFVGPLMVHNQPSCPLIIGGGLSFQPFVGEIAKFKVFTCIRNTLAEYTF